MWHVLDVESIWMKEFAAALSDLVPVKCWAPKIRNFGWCERWERVIDLPDPRLRITEFPLQRCYSRFHLDKPLGIGRRVAARLLRNASNPRESTLVCTSPFYAPVAECWPGRVIYYLTDLVAAYPGMDRPKVEALDRRICGVADLVCPNSRRTAEYLRTVAACDPKKLLVIPNATRQRNLLPEPLYQAASLPEDLKDLPRPIVGVMGNLSYNLNWRLLLDVVKGTPEFSWAFVGPTDMKIADAGEREARRDLMARGGRIRFTGAKPYGALCKTGRALDVAFLPYQKNEATFSASATRFYEHLAACRPILSTRGMEELLHKEPLLKLVDNASDVVAELKRLRKNSFRDGYEEARWKASADGTWQARANAMVNAVEQGRWPLVPVRQANLTMGSTEAAKA
jgi:glycosyltransferase involved in cell wall biosynthesis